jgi:hypothetical protein
MVYRSELTNLALSGEAGDRDGDGIPNLVEYALGLEPTTADPPPLHAAILHEAQGDNLTLAYSQLSVLSDIQFTWESSVDLVGWQPATPAHDTLAGSGFLRTRTADFPLESSKQRYFRVAVKRTL